MTFHIWLLEESGRYDFYLPIIHRVLGTKCLVTCFSSLQEIWDQLHRLSPPDLVIGDLISSVKGTQIISLIRNRKPVDLIPLMRDPSPSLFIRSQQLGCLDYLLLPAASYRFSLALRKFLYLKTHLVEKGRITQRRADRYHFYPFPSVTDPFRDLTPEKKPVLRKLLKLLDEKGPMTSEEAGKLLSLSRIGARNYLELLLEAGLVLKETPPPHRRGRPLTLYKRKK